MSDHGDYAGWTAEKPTEAGWYWWRLDDGQLQVVYVSKYGTVTISGVGKRSLKRLDGEWLGPLTPEQYIEWAQRKERGDE